MTLNWEQRKQAPTRVLLAGGEPRSRRVLADLLTLRPGIALLGETSSHQEAASVAAEIQPEVVLMDVRLPDVTAVLASRAIRSNLPSSHILFLSTSADSRTVLAATLAGASGHVLKSLNLVPLQEAVEAAGHGRLHLSHRIADGIVEWFCGGVASFDRGTSTTLSRADRLLLTDIASGRLDSELARATGRPPEDIQAEVARLYEVLNDDHRFSGTGNSLARLLVTPGERS